jgi:hypothetical protein
LLLAVGGRERSHADEQLAVAHVIAGEEGGGGGGCQDDDGGGGGGKQSVVAGRDGDRQVAVAAAKFLRALRRDLGLYMCVWMKKGGWGGPAGHGKRR